MNPSLNKLYKFLKLEVQNDYSNRAVIGGLEKVLGVWENEARLGGVPEPAIQCVVACFRTYGSLEPPARAEALIQLWRQLQQNAGEKLPSLAIHVLVEPPKLDLTAPEPRLPLPKRPRPPKPEPVRGEPPPPRAVEEPAPALTPPAASPPSVSVPQPAARSQPPRPPAQPVPEEPPAALDAPVTVLSGIGESHGATFAHLGIHTLGDMLYYFPRRYDDYTQLKPISRLQYGEEVTVIGLLQSLSMRPVRGGRAQFTEAVVSDGSGAMRLTFWNPYIGKRLRSGMQVVLSGKVDQYLGRLVMVNPEVEPLEQENLNTNRIVPVYPLTSKITQHWLRRQMHQVVSYWSSRVRDYVPETTRRLAGLMDLSLALAQAHFPDSKEQLQAARFRLAFDEIFLLQLGVLRQKRFWQARAARVFEVPNDWLEAQIARLPFPLTRAQRRVLEDMRSDLASGRPMNRLIQGDVGSGKTVVAALGMLMVIRQPADVQPAPPVEAPADALVVDDQSASPSVDAQPAPPLVEAPADVPVVDDQSASPSADVQPAPPSALRPQAAIMAPTGILAEQHYKNLLKLLTGVNTQPDALPSQSAFPLAAGEIRLLVGSTPAAERREILEELASGKIKILVGTHALLEEPVTFADLEFVVIDEQHRFGVEQRSVLRSKGQNPHLLVMTATPIPRSLALTIYGDLDLSVIDEMPPGRQPVSTYIYFPRERENVYTKIRSEVAQGRQAFIIYPLVEESGKERGAEHSAERNAERSADRPSEAQEAGRSAVEEHTRLQREIFPKLKIGLLHGRMKAEEKDAVMADFRDGKLQILVSTSVVEVGVDVPNATVMVIEGANRFGLSQLHQFRGRVGRGQAQSCCVLIPDKPDNFENERLKAMVETTDGFALAERDLDQRGPGDFLGTRQAGFAELKMASLTDVRLIEKARQQAQSIFLVDPDLERAEHHLLRAALRRFWGSVGGDIS